MRTNREPRDRTSPVPGFRRPRIRTLIAGASGIAAGVLVALGTAGGTYAYLDGHTTLDNGTVLTAGTAELDVVSSFTSSSWSNMLVGESVRQSFTITNGGAVPLALTASGTTSAAGFELRVAPGSCPTTALAGTSITATPSSVGTLAAGATTTACLEVRLVTGAAAGATSTMAVVIDGAQVH